MKKTISNRGPSGLIAFLSFMLLFPGFFIYNYLLARAYIPPLLGGYFGNVALALSPIMALLSCKTLKPKINGVALIFFGVITLTLATSFLNYVNNNPLSLADEMLLWSISGVLFNLVTYFIGSKLDIEKHHKYISVAFFILVYLVLTNIGELGILYLKQEATGPEDFVATYQGFARSLAFTALILNAYYWQKSGIFFIFFAAGLVALFFNGARTEFVAFTATAFPAALLFSNSRYKTLLLTIFFGACVLSFLAFGIAHLPESRMLELVNPEASSSASARSYLSSYGIQIISDNPILGGYGGYVKLGGVGDYPHNILSAWVNLGLLGFCAYVMAFLLMWKSAAAGFIFNKSSNEYKIFLFFLVFTSISMLFSKDYSYMSFGFLVGAYSKYRQAGSSGV